jgi:hypothetical protein
VTFTSHTQQLIDNSHITSAVCRHSQLTCKKTVALGHSLQSRDPSCHHHF